MGAFIWYQEIIKPWWAPPAWLFGPVWMVLYVIIAVSFATVFYRNAIRKLDSKTPFPFILNVIFNVIYTPIQFGLRNNVLGSIDILLVLGTLIWAIIAIYPKIRWVAYAQIPYLVWVSYATVLQLAITYLNW